MGHIQLSRVSELLVVAPATANLISKFANGIADDLATTLVLATDKKVLLAPSMNVRMWNHPATKENIIKLKQFGFELIGPNSGEMACGEFGLGRMAEPIEIKNQILSLPLLQLQSKIQKELSLLFQYLLMKLKIKYFHLSKIKTFQIKKSL